MSCFQLCWNFADTRLSHFYPVYRYCFSALAVWHDAAQELNSSSFFSLSILLQRHPPPTPTPGLMERQQLLFYVKGFLTPLSLKAIRIDHAFSLALSQVDEIYHDESLGININIVIVRMIMLGYRQVRYTPRYSCSSQAGLHHSLEWTVFRISDFSLIKFTSILECCRRRFLITSRPMSFNTNACL